MKFIELCLLIALRLSVYFCHFVWRCTFLSVALRLCLLPRVMYSIPDFPFSLRVLRINGLLADGSFSCDKSECTPRQLTHTRK